VACRWLRRTRWV